MPGIRKASPVRASPRLEFVTLFPEKVRTNPREIHTNAQVVITRAARSTAWRADCGLSIVGQKRSFQRCMFAFLLSLMPLLKFKSVLAHDRSEEHTSELQSLRHL